MADVNGLNGKTFLGKQAWLVTATQQPDGSYVISNVHVDDNLNNPGDIYQFQYIDSAGLFGLQDQATGAFLGAAGWSIVAGTDSVVLMVDTFGDYIVIDLTGTSKPPEGEVFAPNSPPCFAAGTRIATPRGGRPVEDLTAGDLVLTIDGSAKPVRWIGQRRVDCRSHPNPDRTWPVRILAGAFGEAIPARDLLVSPDHCLFIEGVLIPAATLVNGSTVTQMPVDAITYYHIELDAHDVVLAEGMPAETYLDTGNRHAFANGGTMVQLHPDFAPASRPAPASVPPSPATSPAKRPPVRRTRRAA